MSATTDLKVAVTVPTGEGADIRRQIGTQAVADIAKAIVNHPRFDQLFDGLDGLNAWFDRAHVHYLNEFDRIGPTKARLSVRRIVNEVALIGGAR